MTQITESNVSFQRIQTLVHNFRERDYRHAYVAAQLRGFLSDQLRALRGEMSQKAFGALLGKPQSVVSRLEDQDYGRLSLQTLLDVAERLDIAIIVRFVDFGMFLEGTKDQSVQGLVPAPYDAASLDDYAAGLRRRSVAGGAPAANDDVRGAIGGSLPTLWQPALGDKPLDQSALY
jgi:hypothetical protein